MSGALQSFLGEVGFRAEEVRDMRDFARAAEALASAASLDVGVFVSLLSRATVEGFARSASGDAVVAKHGEGFVLAARVPVARAPSEPPEALHDLGNALTAVAGWARIARAEGSASARGEKALGAIEEATQIALDLARPSPTRGTPSSPPSWQSVGAAVQQAVQLIEPLAAERRVPLHAARGSEVRVPIGRTALVSGIANLVKNAVEASQAGDEVSVGVEARDTAEGRCEVEVHVRGGRASEPPQVGRSTKGAGRGHGLKLVQSLARSAGGDLRFAVAPDKPVVALLTLAGRRHDTTTRSPVPPPRDDERAPRGSGTRLAARLRRETNAALRGVAPSVLVVDDEPSIRELVTTALELAGIHAQGIEGPEALDPRERRTFAIALVDVRLGPKDGLRVARELVEAGWARRFALMTGAPMGHTPDDALAVIKKPFDIEEVVSMIHRWTRAARERKAR